jgi:hypothetical protein
MTQLNLSPDARAALAKALAPALLRLEDVLSLAEHIAAEPDRYPELQTQANRILNPHKEAA